jgi:ferredoxin
VFAKSGREVACKGADFILDLALDGGLEAAFSCRSGQCGTCKVALVEGSVEHDCAEGLTEDDVRDGFILLCQAHPKGRVIVEL